jgi:hypothetical protein
MKKTVALLACAAALLLLPTVALADATKSNESSAQPIALTLTLPEEKAAFAQRLTDDFVISRVSFKINDLLTIEPKESAGTLVLNWYDAPASYTVTQLGASGETLSEETIADTQLARQIVLDSACKKITVLFLGEGSLGGVAAYGAGAALPLAFSSAPEQCDLLIISAEPGMEWMQFGAVLPTYAKEKGITTGILYVSDYGKRARAYEALAGLRAANYTSYPIFAGYQSDNYDSYKTTSDQFDRRAFVEYLKTQIKQLNPKVIVTHAVSDPSGAHSLVSECVQIAVKECPSVQKLYCFGAEDGATATTLDLNTPLNAYAGKTAAEVAQGAMDKQGSRRIFGLTIDQSSAYTLAYSTTGDDEARNDLFEHIDTASLLTYSPAVASPAPQPEASATTDPVAEETAQPEATTATGPVDATTQPDDTAPQPQETNDIPVFAVAAAGLLLSLLLFLVFYKRIRLARGKGGAICICLIPFALGLAATAVLAGGKTKPAAATAPQVSITAQATGTPQPTKTPAPSETPSATETPEPTAQPATDADAQYYRKASDPAEVIVVDVENGHWEYRNDNLGISIDRVKTQTSDHKPLTYFVADIHMRDLTEFRPGFGAEGHTGRGATRPWIIARREKAVLWLTGDNLINDEREEKGILIRDGRKFWSANKEDTLAIYPDMSMGIVKKNTTNSTDLLEAGVENAYSFGPTLIDDGVVNTQAKYHRVRRANPRTAIGYLSPGHYLAIVVDGRQPGYSLGMPVWDLADLFASYGCTVAYNLDGGLSAAMIFMGEQLNTHSGKRSGAVDDISYQRAVPDGLMFGYSNQVPSVDDPVLNNGNNGNSGRKP